MPAEPTAAWSGVRRGPLRAGEWVRLSDPKGRHHSVLLEAGKQFFTNKGAVEHDALIGGPDGVVVRSSGGVDYLALRPLLSEYVVSMPRGAAVVYPKDAAQVVGLADIFPGAHVVEAGAGSGSLTCALLRAVGEGGLVSSYERRADFADIARTNVHRFFGGPHPAWRLTVADLVGSLSETEVDRIVLDLLAPWECVEVAGDALTVGGLVCAYVATTPQLSRTVETLRAHGGFTEPYAWETLLRSWHVEGLSVRPDHKMNGHTGFLVTSRRMAAGVQAPRKKRRPAPGAYGSDYTGPRPAGGQSADIDSDTPE
ncbi:MAG: tRNA (adenine-N1)-methyltransferase [Actinomycetota bacterium]|jgi:tRNA (adenine57-N1/adenine58-N1)-methyltransferase|nr:tRNA (adenine-N1)-methyltransferase [Actinomycetota bacterium]